MVQLTDDLIELLDREALRRELSRSALIREAVEHHLAEARRGSIGRRIVEGYQRVPPAEPDGWASLGDLADLAATETAQRLDDEERRAGFAPW
ncbi:hypothetical protein BH20ACT3_BH20ACT3_13700 [soil metagenome]